MSEYVLTAKKGTNADLFPDILKLYVPLGSRVLDMTWGKGVFWKKVNQDYYDLIRNDLDPERGDVTHDFMLEMPFTAESFDCVVLDPPYLYTGGFKTLKASIDKGYQNKIRAEQGIHGSVPVHHMYYKGMMEAWRLLKPKGVLIVKCMDQVQSGRRRLQHEIISQFGRLSGFDVKDLFVLVTQAPPVMRHEHQIHARQNHSYFIVFTRLSRNA